MSAIKEIAIQAKCYCPNCRHIKVCRMTLDELFACHNIDVREYTITIEELTKKIGNKMYGKHVFLRDTDGLKI